MNGMKVVSLLIAGKLFIYFLVYSLVVFFRLQNKVLRENKYINTITYPKKGKKGNKISFHFFEA